MRILVESLKRLYSAGKISDEKIDEMESANKISSEEKIFIKDNSSV